MTYPNQGLKALWLMVAWYPFRSYNVFILVVDYISELTIHSVYVHPFCVKGNVQYFIYSELDVADCAELV